MLDKSAVSDAVNSDQSPSSHSIQPSADYSSLPSQKLPPYRPSDLSLLTDAGWVSQTLQNIMARKEQQHQALAQSSLVAPARLPTAVDAGKSTVSTILGPIDEDVWEGVGGRVDVVLFE